MSEEVMVVKVVKLDDGVVSYDCMLCEAAYLEWDNIKKHVRDEHKEEL